MESGESSPHGADIMSAMTPRPKSPEAMDHASTLQQHAIQRERWLVAQDEFMNTLSALRLRFQTDMEDNSSFVVLDQALRAMELVARQIHHVGVELKGLDIKLKSFHDLDQIDRLPTKAAPGTGQGFQERYPESHEFAYANVDESIGTDYADLYYQHASAVRYISDNLINLGPRPPDDIIPQSGSSEDEDDDFMSNTLTPYEYAERHLKLLKDLVYERQEAARMKEICLQHNIVLDDDTQGGTDESEDVYQALLDDLENGAPRIESQVKINRGQQQYPVEMTTECVRSDHAFRIAEWAANVDLQREEDPGPVPTAPTAPMITLNEGEEQVAVQHQRRHIRSKSTSQMFQHESPAPGRVRAHSVYRSPEPQTT